MIIIDTNALIILILGFIDTSLIKKHKRTSLYEEQDFHDLMNVIKDIKQLVVLPNVWTEVDNLLNNFNGELKYSYIEKITNTIKSTSETYIASLTATEHNSFYDLGLTDALLLEYAKKCSLLVTSDSTLSDYAIANGVKVYDVVKNRNERLM